MPLIGVDRDGRRAEVPVASVGLLQNAAEMPRTPAYDLFPFMSAHPAWDVRLSTDRTFGGVREPSGLGALVVGYNALHLSRELREAFVADPPGLNLVMLHQLGAGCHDFLRGNLAVRCVPMPGGACEEAWVPEERTRRTEPLLSWPLPVERPQDAAADVVARSLRYLAFEPGSAWRVVLEARVETHRGRRRVPVVIRTADFVPQRIVVSTLLLEPARHAALLENLVTYATFGRPEVAVLDPDDAPDGYDAPRLAQRLRLQGARVVRVPLAAAEDVNLREWPLEGVDRVVVPSTIDDEQALAGEAGTDWLQRGGTLVRIGGDQGLSLRTGATDLHWMARRWAVWFNGTRPDTWLRSLFGTRAVLAMLAALERSAVQRDDLGVGVGPQDFERQIAALLAQRIRNGSAEETIGATVAAWDLHVMLGGRGLAPGAAAEVEAWLRARHAEALTSPEDRLDIARALGHAALLRDAIAAAAGGHSATLAVRVREAVLAWPKEAGPLPEIGAALATTGSDEIRHELTATPLLSAELVTAAHRCETQLPGDHLLHARPAAYDVAVEAMGRLGGLAGNADLAGADAYALSVEGMALLHYLASGDVSAFQVRPEGRLLPVKTVESVLGETRSARDAEEDAHRDAAALATAVHLLGAVALTGVVLAVCAMAGVLDVRIGATNGWPAYPGVLAAAVAIGVVRWLVVARGERPELRLAQMLLAVLVLLLIVGLSAIMIHLFDGLLAATAVVLIVVGVAAVVAVALDRYRLNPPWMADLLAVFSEPGGPLKWARDRLGRSRAGS